MALLLTVIEPRDESLGERGSIVFGVGGGRIGRALDNDWVLPDPLRYLSSHHARVRFRRGTFFIEDISTNGVYLNGSEQPLGKSGPRALHSGDLLRLGAYQIQVQLDDDIGPPPDPSLIVPVTPQAATSTTRTSERDIGVDLDLKDLLMESTGGTSRRLRPVDAFGQPVSMEPPRPFETPRAASAAARREARNSTAQDTAAEAFFRGAGIATQSLPPELQQRALHLAGLLLRESLVGIRDLSGTQREIRRQSGMSEPRQDTDREALNRLSVEDLLRRLLGGADQQTLDAVQWLRELYALSRRHDDAMMRALRAALADFTQRLAPAALSDGTAAADRFRSMIDMPSGQLPHLFAEALARRFDAELQNPPGGS